MERLVLGFEWYIAFLFSTVFHEAAHALAALKLGDRTAYYGGQVTLDPIPHIRREPVGTVLVPILSYLVGGWMIGWASAPYDPFWAYRHPRRAAWMALAGPVANLILLLLAALAIRGGMMLGVFSAPTGSGIRFVDLTVGKTEGLAGGAAVLLSIFFTLNLLLFVFNLIPLPPLDGSGVLPLFMHSDAARRYQDFLRTPMVSLIGLLIAWQLFGPVFRPIHIFAMNLLYIGTGHHYGSS